VVEVVVSSGLTIRLKTTSKYLLPGLMVVNGTKRSAILTSSVRTDGLFFSTTSDGTLFETFGVFDGTDGDTSSFGGSDFGESDFGESSFGKSNFGKSDFGKSFFFFCSKFIGSLSFFLANWK